MADRLEFDSVTRALLSELQKDARQTNKALAEKVGLAPSTCLERVRELRARGVISRFSAVVEPASVGRPMEAILSIQQRAAEREAIETRNHAEGLVYSTEKFLTDNDDKIPAEVKELRETLERLRAVLQPGDAAGGQFAFHVVR